MNLGQRWTRDGEFRGTAFSGAGLYFMHFWANDDAFEIGQRFTRGVGPDKFQQAEIGFS
jgi:hypothetical protein